MGKCLICKANVKDVQSFLTIRTLHIRNFSGTSRIQGVGRIVEGTVCDDCIHRQINNTLHPVKQSLKKLVQYAALTAAGILIAAFIHDNVIRIFGASAALCGILCLYSDLKKALEQQKITKNNNDEQNHAFYSYSLIINNLPRKNGEEDLSYIPLNAGLAAESPESLCIQFGLLPEIAVEVRDIAKEYFGIVR
jgi:hypothetical protein